MAEVLGSAFAGSFYPGDKISLHEAVTGFLQCDSRSFPRALGMVVPHAGYIYSGRTAGHGFASAPDNVANVVICAPSHRYPLPTAAVIDVDGIETPLGLCPVNREITSRLAEYYPSQPVHEHSLEVMIPFVQTRWPSASIVPLILGAHPDCLEVAGHIDTLTPDSFFVASSDLSHFHPLSRAKTLDRSVIDAFLTLNPAEFSHSLRTGGEACGRNPILTLIHLSRMKGQGAEKAYELHYTTSADAGAGEDEVVGYFAGIVSL